MLAVILKILSIIGIVLLVALCVLAVLLLIVLFCPVVYRINGKKDSTEMTAKVRVRWLFGLLRAAYCYPEPGRLIVKILCFPIFDSGAEKKPKKKKHRGSKKKEKQSEGTAADVNSENQSAENQSTGSTGKGNGNTENRSEQNGNAESVKEDTETLPEQISGQAEAPVKSTVPYNTGKSEKEKAGKRESEKEKLEKEAQKEEIQKAESEQKEAPKEEYSEKISEETLEKTSEKENNLRRKIEKIKYTICGIYDKIKHILEELGFYKELLQDEDTKALFSHGCRRLGKVLKNIRPRKLKADITYGTGSPDTTGYLYGFYGMLSPKLGKDICIVPDFEEPILEGSLYAAGHITVCTLLINMLALLLDKRLRILIGRLKAHRAGGQK